MSENENTNTSPDIIGEAEKKETMIAQSKVPPSRKAVPPLVVNGPAVPVAAILPSEPVAARPGKLEIHEVENGYVVLQAGRAFGVKKDDFAQVQRLLKGGDVVNYNTLPAGQTASAWQQTRPVNIAELGAVAMACEGLVVIHKLQNCYMIVSPKGAHLASTGVDGLAELGRIFKEL